MINIEQAVIVEGKYDKIRLSSVINGGNLMKPQIVKEIRDENGIIKRYQPEIKNKVISEKTSQTMREVLESVVSSPTGSGKNAYIKGYRIGGKTGTSEDGVQTSGSLGYRHFQRIPLYNKVCCGRMGRVVSAEGTWSFIGGCKHCFGMFYCVQYCRNDFGRVAFG